MVLLFLVLGYLMEQSKKPFMRNFKNVLWRKPNKHLKLFCKKFWAVQRATNKRYKITSFSQACNHQNKTKLTVSRLCRNNAARDANIGQNLPEERKKWSPVFMRSLLPGIVNTQYSFWKRKYFNSTSAGVKK